MKEQVKSAYELLLSRVGSRLNEHNVPFLYEYLQKSAGKQELNSFSSPNYSSGMDEQSGPSPVYGTPPASVERNSDPMDTVESVSPTKE